MAQTTNAQAATTVSLDQMLTDNLAKSSLSKSQEVVVIVKSVTDWKATLKGNLPRKMVITDKGSFWVLASSIKNLPASFGQPVQAKAVISQNGQYLNMNRLEFPGLETSTLLAIRELPSGTALFASAKDVRLAV